MLCVKQRGMNIFLSDLCYLLSHFKQGDKLEYDLALVDLGMWILSCLPPATCLHGRRSPGGFFPFQNLSGNTEDQQLPLAYSCDEKWQFYDIFIPGVEAI